MATKNTKPKKKASKQVSLRAYSRQDDMVRAQTVFFVGIHNKPGMAALDSQTRSGKLVDRIITELRTIPCIKSNLYDLDYCPDWSFDDKEAWARRVGIQDYDVVVLLGEEVQYRWLRSPQTLIKLHFVVHIPHPSAMRGKTKWTIDQYVSSSIDKIQHVCLHAVQRSE